MKAEDELMWLIADDGDSSAMDAFIRRHPEHRAEMLKRFNMVKAMRQCRPDAASEPAIPPFALRNVAEPRTTPRWVWSLMGAAACAVVFAGGVFVSGQLQDRRASTNPPSGESSQFVVQQDPSPQSGPDAASPPNTGPQENVVPRPPATIPTDKWKIPVRIEDSETTLFAVFNRIESETGVKLTILPGLGNVRLSAFYYELPALDILKDLGRRLGFTAFEQGPDEVLIVPAVGSDEGPRPGAAAEGGTLPQGQMNQPQPELPRESID